MSDYEEDFQDIISNMSNNLFLHTKAYETLRSLNHAAWYMHEIIETLDDPEEEIDDLIINSMKILHECAESFMELIEEEYEYDDDEDNEEI